MLDELMFEMYEKVHASNLFIARLHNNGWWNNGRSMKKFTMVQEKVFPMAPSIMQDYKDVLCSRYPEAMDYLFYHGMYTSPDLDLCKDRNLKTDFQVKYKFSSLYFFLIAQADGDRTEEAFIGVLFKEPRVLRVEEVDFIKSQRFKILGLLNMTKKS